MITAEDRQLRRRYIGSSDAPCLFGADPFKTAADLWLMKTGRAEDAETNDAMRRGNFLEPAIIAWAEEHLGRPLRRTGLFVRRPDCDELCANLDAFLPPCDVAPGGAVIEAKTASTATNPDEWGEAGSDEVPERVIIQNHHAMWLVGQPCRVAFVPVLLPVFGRFDFRMYRVERNDELAEAIAAEGRRFKREYVDGNTPPPDVLPSLEVLKRVRREPATVEDVPDDVVDAWIAERAARLDAEKREEAAQAALLAAMKSAEGGRHSGGLVTYLETHRKAYAVEAKSYRQLRLKKG